MNLMQMAMNLMNQNCNNPIVGNMMGMAQKNDMQGIEKLARNIGKEKGVDVDSLFREMQGKFGYK